MREPVGELREGGGIKVGYVEAAFGVLFCLEGVVFSAGGEDVFLG